MWGVPWPAVGSLLSGVGTLILVVFLHRYRGKPGTNWVLLTLVSQAVWCFAYGIGLLVFDPTLRWVLEVLTWTGIVWSGVLFLAFALEYTDRGSLVRTPWFNSLFVLPAVTTVLVATNPLHELVWSGFRIEPVYGGATVSYAHNVWAFVAIVAVSVFIAVGALLLFDKVISYGPLYRTEALAVVIGTLPPIASLLAWLFQLGPYPLNLAPITFLPYILLDTYAFAGDEMFAYSPSVRRTANRSAVDDLESPFLVVDMDERIVDCNPAAESLFDVSKPDVLGRSFERATGLTIDDAGDRIVTQTDRGERRELTVSTSRLRNESGQVVGHTVILQDITDQRRREQRLEILNRVLRHNLRNDLTAVRGYVGLAADRVDDGDLAGMLEATRDDIDGVLEMSEKARAFERAIASTARTPEPFAPRDVLAPLAADLEAETGGRVDVAVPAGLCLRADRDLFELAFENLLENGLVHSDSDTPRVTVELERLVRDGTAVFTVRDDGPGIPAHELAVLERGEETALEHGSGIGLWIVSWSVAALGGELAFETTEAGTTATVSLPGVVESPTPSPTSEPSQS